MKISLCIPTRKEPIPQLVAAVDASLPLLREAGHVVGVTTEIGSAYISFAAANMLAQAMIWGADVVVFIEDDHTWAPEALLKLIETPGDVVSGNYRYKDDSGDFMAIPLVKDGKIYARRDGCLMGDKVPAGFLKITPECVRRFRAAYPELICDNTEKGTQFIDLFNHGAFKGVWYGQDFAFSRRWRAIGGEIWIVPDLDISHWIRNDDGSYTEYPGNYQKHVLEKQGPLKMLERVA
jgi:hypothetical protein